MPYYMGIDIGGTKIAGAVFDGNGKILAEKKLSTPVDYPAFLKTCSALVNDLEKQVGESCHVGVGVAGAVDQETGYVFFPANLDFMKSVPFRNDLEKMLKREIRVANDASCAAIAEAIDGAGAGYKMVLGYIIGTGVGSSVVYNGKLITGLNGMTGEIGHLPLPYREEVDGPLHKCGCGQMDCVETFISGPALARLYEIKTGKVSDAKQISQLADQGDADALRTMDHYYELVAKAMITALYSFDPDVIVVSGGLSGIKGIYEEVPKRWGRYSVVSNIKTKLVPAKHGPMAGMRGAAWLWRND